MLILDAIANFKKYWTLIKIALYQVSKSVIRRNVRAYQRAKISFMEKISTECFYLDFQIKDVFIALPVDNPMRLNTLKLIEF